MVISTNAIVNHILVKDLLSLMVLILVPWWLVNLPNAYLLKVKDKSIYLGRKQEILKKFNEGGRTITFLTCDGAYEHNNKVLKFIQEI